LRRKKPLRSRSGSPPSKPKPSTIKRKPTTPAKPAKPPHAYAGKEKAESAAREAADKAAKTRTKTEEHYQSQSDAIKGLQSKLEYALEKHGDTDRRSQAIHEAEAALDQAKAAEKAQQDKLRELGAEQLEIDEKRLSHGTREQVALALRLAMAQLLAADHDGCLPLVLDDAFTHADKDRLEKLKSLLYQASQSGLQILLLSCHPENYSGLGASEAGL
jgi:recombinational DNA repair ATPase RecF